MYAITARKWLIVGSLVITAAQMAFFSIAPAIDFPITYSTSFRLLEITFPVFLGYLGTASHFVFKRPKLEDSFYSPYLGILVVGSIVIYCVMIVSSFVGFAYSNREGAIPGGGMSVEILSTALSSSLGFLAVTTSILITYLFASGGDSRYLDKG